MQRNQINKEDIIHWSSIGRDFKAYYISEEKIYELKVSLPLRIDNEKDAIEWIKNLVSFSDEITLNELLNNDDRIMTSTNHFKDRVNPIIQKERDKKINTIINGK